MYLYIICDLTTSFAMQWENKITPPVIPFMTVNTKKTQTIKYNKSGHHIPRHFNVGKDRLDSTREYEYLGFMVTPSGEIGTGLKDLKNRALRALSKLKKKMGVYFRKYPTITLKLFRSLIEPILLYASDFWGGY